MIIYHFYLDRCRSTNLTHPCKNTEYIYIYIYIYICVCVCVCVWVCVAFVVLLACVWLVDQQLSIYLSIYLSIFFLFFHYQLNRDVREGATPFSEFLHFTLDTDLSMLSEARRYQVPFLRIWYNSTWDCTPVSRATLYPLGQWERTIIFRHLH